MQTVIALTPKRQIYLRSLQAQITQTISAWVNDEENLPNGSVSLSPDGTALVIDSPDPEPAPAA